MGLNHQFSGSIKFVLGLGGLLVLIGASLSLRTAPLSGQTTDPTPTALFNQYLPKVESEGEESSTIPTRTPVPAACIPSNTYAASDAAVDQAIEDGINSDRSAANLSAYRADEMLIQAARQHAVDMAENRALSHTGSDGSTAAMRIEAACYEAKQSGEIIGWGFPSAEAMLTWWRNSAEHSSNIQSEAYVDYGVAYLNRPGSEFTNYYVVTFAEPVSAGLRTGQNYQCVTIYEGVGVGLSIMVEQTAPCD
ncbi:MAG: CAP domain-containing protein [Chloroflexota bacterium]